MSAFATAPAANRPLVMSSGRTLPALVRTRPEGFVRLTGLCCPDFCVDVPAQAAVSTFLAHLSDAHVC